MRSLSVIDVIIITGVLVLLFFLSTKDFPRYAGRTFGATPVVGEKS